MSSKLVHIALTMSSTHRFAAVLFAMTLLAVAGDKAQGQFALSALGAAPQVVTVESHWSQQQAMPGDQRVLAVVIEIDGKWHINPDPAQMTNPTLVPTTFVREDDAAVLRVGPAQFPRASSYEVNFTGEPMEIPAFSGRTVVYVPVMVAENAQPGTYALKLKLTYQACDDRNCLRPQDVAIEKTLTVVTSREDVAAMDSGRQALFGDFDPAIYAAMIAGATLEDPQARSAGLDLSAVRFDAFGWEFTLNVSGVGFIALLLVAAIGGLLLNFTPCVLPVIPIKIMGLAQSAGSRGRTLFLGVMMAAGVMAFWLALGLVIATVSGFTATNQLFQYPVFSVTVGVIILVMAIGMCGLFAVRLPAAVYRVSPRHDSVGGSLGFGVMTAVLSTPCTAPFMGTAAAWAATTDVASTLLTFVAIGGGMALPYVVLAANPRWVDRMPRTGPASELVKQVMGLLMLAVAAWFLGIGFTSWFADGTQAASKLYWWPVGLLSVVAGGWLMLRTWQITAITSRRALFGGLGAVIVLVAVVGTLQFTGTWDRMRGGEGGGPIPWVYYTPERFDAALAAGDVVALEFTAEWCLNCKALEQSVLFTRPVVQALTGPGVVPMKVDLTGNNPTGNAKLSAMGRVMIPLLVIFSPDGQEVFKSDYYTAEQVISAVAEARAMSSPD